MYIYLQIPIHIYLHIPPYTCTGCIAGSERQRVQRASARSYLVTLNIHWIYIEHTLNIHCIYMEYTLNIRRIRPYAYIYVHIRTYICTNAHTYLLTYTYIYLHWLHCWGRATASAASVSEVVLSYLEYTLNIHCIYIAYTLHIHWVYIEYTLNIHCIYIEYTLNTRFPFIARTGLCFYSYFPM